MSNQTVTTSQTLEAVIVAGLGSGQNLTINSGAVVTVDKSPTVLVGQVVINQGELVFDGANAANPIVFPGEETEEINVNGAGVLRLHFGLVAFSHCRGWNGRTGF